MPHCKACWCLGISSQFTRTALRLEMNSLSKISHIPGDGSGKLTYGWASVGTTDKQFLQQLTTLLKLQAPCHWWLPLLVKFHKLFLTDVWWSDRMQQLLKFCCNSRASLQQRPGSSRRRWGGAFPISPLRTRKPKVWTTTLQTTSFAIASKWFEMSVWYWRGRWFTKRKKKEKVRFLESWKVQSTQSFIYFLKKLQFG